MRRRSAPLRLLALAATLALAGCAARAPPPPPREVVVFEGACDASGAVPLADGTFAVADDEDNRLRIYDAVRGGPPLRAVDVSAALGLPPGKRRPPELDLEAATGLGEVALWLGSHGRKSSGKLDPSRFLLFGVDLSGPGDGARLVGRPYGELLAALLAAPELAALDLARAAALPPKEPGGLNLEGMTATPDGRAVLIGFRSPVPDGLALVVPLENPREVLDGATARLGAPHRLALGGRGVRSISWWRGTYLLAAGSPGAAGGSRLYTWRPGEAPRELAVELHGLNPEGFVSHEDRDEVLVLSDDGATLVGGVECKRLTDPARKRFRALRLRL